MWLCCMWNSLEIKLWDAWEHTGFPSLPEVSTWGRCLGIGLEVLQLFVWSSPLYLPCLSRLTARMEDKRVGHRRERPLTASDRCQLSPVYQLWKGSQNRLHGIQDDTLAYNTKKKAPFYCNTGDRSTALLCGAVTYYNQFTHQHTLTTQTHVCYLLVEIVMV